MNSAELDHLTIITVSPALLDGEADLYKSKWWDYRLMHPLEATRVFADAYVKAMKSALKKQIDIYIGMNARVLKKGDLLLESKTTITGLWKARKIADKHGVPYEFWCHRAMEYADLCCWPYPPKPCHLYSESVKAESETWSAISMVEFILTRWNEWRQVNLLVSTDDFYQIENNVEHPYQRAHRISLMRQIQRSSRPEFSLAAYVYENPMLKHTEAIQQFGEKAVARAKILAE
ncbi:conserved hypothetical protein [Vibrio coralliirubri]|uniref:hypothetical protein n=1 Tax=Vibrio coralliirubri TaxID=1516159 RepID=UPI0006347D1E|nr:hypothetical protein [Vibrio coralliirubri]CDT54019.1 conserved hypothetical protein [Vibrio coralliirubri]